MKKRVQIKHSFFGLIGCLIVITLLLFSCNQDDLQEVEPSNQEFKAKNVVIVMVDGPRFVDSWNNESVDNIPEQRSMLNEGTFFSHFYNDGYTYTVSGHTAICTGFYEDMENGGNELPSNPSIFQLFLESTYLPPNKSYIITGKEKLNVLSNSKDFNWKNSFKPLYDAEDRADSLTLKRAKDIFTKNQPILSLVHFKGPDYYGHKNDWGNYIRSIQETDRYVADLWRFIQANDFYKDNTACFITADHGRHLNNVSDGFKGHGDHCDGCKHIYLLALGPDFKKGKVVTQHQGQIDIAPTIAKILNFEWEGEGKELKQLTTNNK